MNSTLTLPVQSPVNGLLSAAAERPHTEPWKHRGMDQLCAPEAHTAADKGCPEAGGRPSGGRMSRKQFVKKYIKRNKTF